MLLVLFSIRTRRVVSLQILWPSQFTQTWPKRCRVHRHFDEGSCRYPRTLYHCDLDKDMANFMFIVSTVPVHQVLGHLQIQWWPSLSGVYVRWNQHFITHAPLFRGGAAYVYELPLGDSCLIMNIHNPFMHCVMSQYMFKSRDVIMLNNRINVATIMYATASPCSVPLNGVFHQDSGKQWNKLQIYKNK